MHNQMQPPQSRFSGRKITALVLLAIGVFLGLATLVGMGSTPTVRDYRGVETDCSTVNPARPSSSGGVYGGGPSMQDYVNASNLAKTCEAAMDAHSEELFLVGFGAALFLVPGVLLLLKNKKANAPYGPPAGRFTGPAGGGYPGPATGGQPGPAGGRNPGPGQA